MRPSRKTIPLKDSELAVQVTDDQSRTLIFPGTSVSYHSGSGARSETEHVYLRNSGVADRLRNGQPTSVLEIGLGTGMGMLLTLDLAQANNSALEYTAVENCWLEAELLRELQLDQLISQPPLVDRYLQWREEVGSTNLGGEYRWDPGDRQTITVANHDARDWVVNDSNIYEAIFFDPFAPDTNPELWQASFLTELRRRLRDDGRLVTYSVGRAVRDAFTTAGFNVARVPGPPGGKREVMIATNRGE